MAKQKRIVCYAINGAGLGHVTRLLSVAKWLRRFVSLLEEKPPEILFLTSSDASDILADAGFAAFKIPSKTVAHKTDLNKLEYRRLAKHFVWNMLGVFSPDLLVVDTFPAGSFDELFQVLDGPFRKSFIYRKVKPEYAARPTFRSAMRMYDCVVAPHGASEVATFPDCGQTIQASGEVIQFEREELLDAESARDRLGVPKGCRLVYVSAGGGGDPGAESQLKQLVDTVSKIDNVHLLVGAGPLYRGSRMAGQNITWYDGPAIGQYFRAVDAAVSAAGYNTFHELIFAGVPTAFFAQEKIADDQAERIRQAENAGACRSVWDLEDTGQIKSTVGELLNDSTANSIREACESLLPKNGARKCAIELLRPLYGADRLEWCRQVLQPKLVGRLESLTGGSSSLAEWLVPLAPQDRMQSIKSHPALESVMSQLSESATAELKSLLGEQHGSLDEASFEASLIGLFDSIELFPMAQRIGIAGETLKTLVALMKKQPFGIQSNLADPSKQNVSADWTHWICGLISGVNRLLTRVDVDPVEAIRLYRIFPRVVDVDAAESLELFESYLSSHLVNGNQPHEISQSLQLLKMTHSRVTKAILEKSNHSRNLISNSQSQGSVSNG